MASMATVIPRPPSDASSSADQIEHRVDFAESFKLAVLRNEPVGIGRARFAVAKGETANGRGRFHSTIEQRKERGIVDLDSGAVAVDDFLLRAPGGRTERYESGRSRRHGRSVADIGTSLIVGNRRRGQGFERASPGEYGRGPGGTVEKFRR